MSLLDVWAGMDHEYDRFLRAKKVRDPDTGIQDGFDLPPQLFPFQADIVRWALRRGRAALFAGTGLGKSFMELAWTREVARHTGMPVLHLAPLAVASQMIREAAKFGVDARIVRGQEDCGPGINVTNYHKIDHFDLMRFGGIVLDESSILKSQTGHYRSKLVRDAACIPFRLAATATPAPNDFMELGNHAEFLGVMSFTDMLSTFFVHDGGDTAKWRLKGHAENDFWAWMASWSVMLRAPSDLGYENGAYDLPPLVQTQHVVASAADVPVAKTMRERLAARKSTIGARVLKAVEVTPFDEPSIVWCHLNAEQDALEKAFGDMCISIRGAQTDEVKEARLAAWMRGDRPVIVLKPSMFGHGLNFQHCRTMVFVGLNDSFEQVYQAVRRCWRFGQDRQVDVHFVSADVEGAVVANLKRKEVEADRMAAAMVMHTAAISTAMIHASARNCELYDPKTQMETPAWLS